MFVLPVLLILCAALSSSSARGPGSFRIGRQTADPVRRDEPLQDIVTWDEYSLKINGERIFIFSGEVHPYRNPVADLHLDVFQKVKALGFNAVSFYVFWGLHEPKKGEISFEGFRDLQPFIDAAKDAGIYLIARPGPYINAEVSGGGFPGWGVRDPSLWRTSNASYVEAYQLYMKTVNEVIAKNQITNGGPVILYQSENEYTNVQPPYTEDFDYEAALIQTIRDTGIVVPITTNDASPKGIYTTVDLYGHDSYPVGFDCTNPEKWASNAVPQTFWQSHLNNASDIPYAMYEYQGGAFDGWGGVGYDQCAELLGTAFERVFYKNQYSISTTIFNIYMIFGGTNWGGIAHPGVYTSYDYGSAISEDRTLREKYYELKLQAHFLAVSPAYLTTRPINYNSTKGAFTGNSALNVTQTADVVGNQTVFYTVRQSDASSFDTRTYTLSVPTSAGDLSIPTLGGSLTLTGRDSKIHVVDYQAGNTTLLYSTAEIFTWASIDDRDVIIVYGNEGELHEAAFKFDAGNLPEANVVSGSGNVTSGTVASDNLVLQFTTSGQTVVEVGSNVLLYILDRTTAYQFWVSHPPTTDKGAYSTINPIIIKGGYFIRSTSIEDGLQIQGDLNDTATFEIIAPTSYTNTVKFNGQDLQVTKTAYGTLSVSRDAKLPAINLPDLEAVPWKTADSLPELSPDYSDEKWTLANLTTTTNPRNLTTDVNLYSGDYGYHTGNILWRGHFTASGTETGFSVLVAGGQAFGYSVWLDSDFLGSWYGNAVNDSWPLDLSFSSPLASDSDHVITILQDHMGLDEDWWAASDTFKAPRGILSYNITGSDDTNITWKLTGNLGGEDYIDTTRGPLNEGGLYGERQGWHLPGFDDSQWDEGSPTQGLSRPGVSFYRTTFDLDIPEGIDYPIAIVTTNSTSTNTHFRSKFYVNGWQFGRYSNSIGPQTSFPVPKGVLDPQGTNTLAVALWATEPNGARLAALSLNFTAKIESSIGSITNVPFTPWAERPGAY